jgi:SpoVK/Ycf46/Vps4 family AAA+-type ATPase
MLQSCERIVVFLDEFDELVSEREEAGELESRFLTTAMLPKLASLSDRRRAVVLVATNHPERFDAAIRRRGRFDMIVPVMPPTADAKLEHWPILQTAISALGDADRMREAESLLADLTYHETEALVARLKGRRKTSFEGLLVKEHSDATLNQRIRQEKGPEDETWKGRMERMERDLVTPRIPGAA